MLRKTKNHVKFTTRLENWILSHTNLDKFDKRKNWVLKHFNRWDTKLLDIRLNARVNKAFKDNPSIKRDVWSPVLNTQINQLCSIRACGGKLAEIETLVLQLDIAISVVKNLRNLDMLVGIQPMQAPVGLSYLMTYKDAPVTVDGIPQISLEIQSQAVEAVTRKLQSTWPIEAAQDLMSMHRLDVASEIASIVGISIAEEIVEEILVDLFKLAGTPTTVEDTVSDEKYKNLFISINKAAIEIARLTRRGMGNYIICTPYTLELLKKIYPEVLIPNPAVSTDSVLINYGMIGSIRVIVTNSSKLDNKILIGYKGRIGETDAGFSYNPYMLVSSTGVTIDPQTFQPTVQLLTRYGKTLLNEKTTRFSKSSHYYAQIDITSYAD